MANDDRTKSEIERDLDVTRQALAADISALQNRLDPKPWVDAATRQVSDEAGQLARAAFDHARANPLPVALIAAGLGWLIFSGRSTGPRPAYAPLPDRPRDVPTYDATPADMAARRLEDDADDWAATYAATPETDLPDWARPAASMKG